MGSPLPKPINSIIMTQKEDKILRMFFEPERWQYAIQKGIIKDIKKADLYQLTKPEMRIAIAQAMKIGKYEIAPPHTAKIPKDTPGEFRTVYVNEPIDRVVLSIANDLLFELCPEMVHPRCKSYLKGIGCGKVVKEASREVSKVTAGVIGWKSDLSKYFDSVPLMYIDRVFDMVEEKHGKSALIDVIRKYYHSNLYFNEMGELCSTFQSLKQGCAVAAFLADAILYHIDNILSKLNGYYVRYSDDMLFIGEDYKIAMMLLEDNLAEMDMKLNPKKVEYLSPTKWFKFLGYSIKGESISLSSSRIKTFQKEIEKRTIKRRDTNLTRATNSVVRYLYKGDGEFSWATQVLPVINVKKDIDTLNQFVMDALRAVDTKKTKIGGLGYIVTQENGCIARGTGRNVTANKSKTSKDIKGYLTLGCMHNAIITSRELYNTLVSSL